MPESELPPTPAQDPTGPDDELLTVELAAEEFHLHPVTLRKWIREGTIPATRPQGRRRWWIRRGDMITALEDREAQRKAERQSPSPAGSHAGLATAGDRTVMTVR